MLGSQCLEESILAGKGQRHSASRVSYEVYSIAETGDFSASEGAGEDPMGAVWRVA